MSVVKASAYLFVFACVSSGCTTKVCPNPESAVHEIPDVFLKEYVADTVSVVLDNYTPDRNEALGTYAHYRDQGSYFEIWGQTIPISTFPARSEPYTIYIDDLWTNTVEAETGDARFKLILSFESYGTEIITKCLNNVVCIDAAPTFHLNDLQLELVFEIAEERGRLAIINPEISVVRATVENSAGMCQNNFWAFLCGFGPRPDGLIGDFESALNDKLDSLTSVISNQLDCMLRSNIPELDDQYLTHASIDVEGNFSFSYCENAALDDADTCD